jgi:alkylation response protein AidB-like acyl-CoA dehydrogenase
MNLDFSEDQKAAVGELRRLLADHPGRRSARAALESRAAYDRTLWQRLGEFGWLGVAIPRQHGGQGLGREMLCGVAGEIGRSLAAVPFGPSILIAADELAGVAGAVVDADADPDLHEIQQGFFLAPGYRMEGGTEEIGKNIIAERVLGLPPDIRVDKNVPFNSIARGKTG